MTPLAQVLLTALASGLLVLGARQSVDIAPLLARLHALSHATHNSELRSDAIAGTDRVRHWINSNEDDTRLYTPAGGQMDADFQVSAVTTRAAPPDVIVILVESRGSLVPGPGTPALTLVADGRPLALSQREQPPSRSGPLLFLSTRAEIPLVEWLILVTAPSVAGRVWDVPFSLLNGQLELLRAWTRLAVGNDPAK